MDIAFLLHPLNYDDFQMRFHSAYFPMSIILRPFFRFLSPFYIKNLFSGLCPHLVFKTKGIQSKKGTSVTCSIIVLPLFAEQIISLDYEKVKSKILQCVKIAEENNSKLIALGGFTSIVSNQGEDIAREVGVALTSGNSLTASLTIEGIRKSSHLLKKNMSDSTFAVIGATGDIGAACAKILTKEFKSTILCSRKINKDDLIVKDIRQCSDKEIRLERDANIAVRDADFVLFATSAFGSIIEVENFKENAIVCDVSLPYNISSCALKKRKDIFIFEGGRAKLPFPEKINNKRWHNLMPNNSIFGCLAEAIALGLENEPISYSLGRGGITEEKISQISLLAFSHGIELADFSYRNMIYNVKELMA